jgi:seryl-tRNA synthetase
MSEDVLNKWDEWISEAERVGEWGDDQDKCIRDLAAELRALREERDEIKRKAVEQSEYIQSHGLTAFEMAGLKARVAELESQVKRWEDLFAVTEEAAEDCRTGVPLLTHEQVFGVAPVPNETDGLPKEVTPC